MSSGSAQFDFGGVSPIVHLPSLIAGLNSPGAIAALNSSTVRASASGSTPIERARSRIVAASRRETPGAVYSSWRNSGTVFASKSWKASAPGCFRISAPYFA